MVHPTEPAGPTADVHVRRGRDGDWRDVRRLHVKLALGYPLVVDVDLNEVFATPDVFWQNFVHVCRDDPDQALFVAESGSACVGMGHVHRLGPQARLEMLYVDGAARRRGIGTALVAAQEAWAFSSGASGLVCHIAEASAGGHLAGTLGWARTGDVAYTEHGMAEHRWEKARPGDPPARRPDGRGQPVR